MDQYLLIKASLAQDVLNLLGALDCLPDGVHVAQVIAVVDQLRQLKPAPAPETKPALAAVPPPEE